MKFRLKVVLDVSAPKSRLSKDDLVPIVIQAVDDCLSDQLMDVLYDAIAAETEADEWDLDMNVDLVDS